jgi:hypothetical protein
MGNKETTTTTTTEVDPDALRTAEFLQAQMILDTLVGKTVASAQIEETRIAISTTDGSVFFFYGFMGARSPGESA